MGRCVCGKLAGRGELRRHRRHCVKYQSIRECVTGRQLPVIRIVRCICGVLLAGRRGLQRHRRNCVKYQAIRKRMTGRRLPREQDSKAWIERRMEYLRKKQTGFLRRTRS
jgi:hypothetical protein